MSQIQDVFNSNEKYAKDYRYPHLKSTPSKKLWYWHAWMPDC